MDQNDLALQLIISAVDRSGPELEHLGARLRTIADAVKGSEFSAAAEGMDMLGKKTKEATQSMADAAKDALALGAAITGVGTLMGGFAYKSAVEYESALADLAKVSKGGMDEALQYSDSLNKLASQYGQNGVELTRAMSNFVQAGYDASDALMLVEVGIKKMIAGDLSAAESSQLLVQILKGFNLEARQSESVVDALNAVSNKYNTNVKELGTGMAMLSPIAKQMGFTFQETTGLLTPIIEVFGSGSEAANALKTGLQKLTDGTDPVISALSSIGVSQRATNGEMKSGKEIFMEVASSLGGLSDAQKQLIIGQLVGIEQAGRMGEVFNRLDKVLLVTNEAMGSTGSATEEVEARLKTAEVQIAKTQEQFRQLSTTLGTQLRTEVTAIIGATGNLAESFDKAVRAGDLSPLLDAIKPQINAVNDLFVSMGANLEGALKGIDWSYLVEGIGKLNNSLGDAFKALLGDIDLFTQSGLQEFIQKVIDILGNFASHIGGVIDGLAPLLDGINMVFEVLANRSPLISEASGYFKGLALSINEGIPALLDFASKIFSVVGDILELTATIGLLVVAWRGLAAMGVPVGAAIATITQAFFSLSPAMVGVIGSLAGLPGLLFALVAAAGAAGYGFGALLNELTEVASGGRSLGSLIYEWTHASEALTESTSGLTNAQEIAKFQLEILTKKYEEGKVSLDKVIDAQAKYKDAFAGLSEEQMKAVNALESLNKGYTAGRINIEEYVNKQGELLASIAPVNEEQRSLATALEAAANQYKQGVLPLEDLVVAQGNYKNAIFASIDAHKEAAAAARAKADADKEEAEAANKLAAAQQKAAEKAANQAKETETLKRIAENLGLVYNQATNELLKMDAASTTSSQAALALGGSLDKVGVNANVMSERITSAGREVLTELNAIAGNALASGDVISAAIAKIAPKLETMAELNELKKKISELGESGKLSSEQVASAMELVNNRIVALGDANPAIEQTINSLKKLSAENIEILNLEKDIALAKGDKAKAAELEQAQLLDELGTTTEIIDIREKELQKLKDIALQIDLLSERKGQLTSAEESELAALQAKYPVIDKVIEKREREIGLLSLKAEKTKQELDSGKEEIALMEEGIKVKERNFEAVQRANAIGETSYDLSIRQAQATAELAKTKGDEEAATRALAEADQLTIEKAEAAVVGKQKEIAAYKELVEATRLKLAADGELTEVDKAQLAAMGDKLTALNQEAAGLQQNAEHTRVMTQANKDAEQAAKEAADEIKRVAEREKEAAQQRQAAAGFIDQTWSQARHVLQKTGGDIEKLNAEFIKLQTQMLSGNVTSFAVWAATTVNAAAEVARQYESQKERVNEAAAALNEWAETGEGVYNSSVAMSEATHYVNGGMSLLGDQELSGLRSALDAANARLERMKELTASAEEKLMDMDASILEAQGKTEEAAKLRESARHQRAMNEIADLREAATGNTSLLSLYSSMADKEKELHALKRENITSDDAKTSSLNNLSAAYDRVHSAALGVEETTKRIGDISLGRLHAQLDAVTEKAKGLATVL